MCARRGCSHLKDVGHGSRPSIEVAPPHSGRRGSRHSPRPSTRTRPRSASSRFSLSLASLGRALACVFRLPELRVCRVLSLSCFFLSYDSKTGRLRESKRARRDARRRHVGGSDEGSSVTVHTRAAATLPRAHVSPDPSTSAGQFHRTRRYGCPLICPTWTWRTSACTQ